MADVIVHLTPSAFTPQEHEPDCPKPEPEGGFGLAGGGYGAYSYCPACGAILWKSIEEFD